VHLYPIALINDYQSATEPFVSTETKALVYTLGVLYSIIGFCFLVMLLWDLKNVIMDQGTSTGEMPLGLSILFLIMCVFRAAFMFLYPQGAFSDDPLSEFIVFEIPTFLLVSVLIVAIYGWKSVVYKKGFFPDSSNKYIVIIGFAIIWAIWIVVVVVYSEVILANNSGASPCPGRVPASHDQLEQNSRDLAITYQVVIIAITIVLCLVFLYFTWLVFETSKGVEAAKRFVISVGLVIILSFLLRCVLFIIYLALNLVSAIYMFITLMISEVIPFALLFLQFNLPKIKKATGMTSTRSTEATGGDSTGGSGNLFFVTSESE
jgi:hypothetical protein